MKKILLIGTLFVGTFLSSSEVLAGEVTARPFLIDETVLPRDVVERTITIKNDYDIRKVVIFATVNEITVDNEGEIMEYITPVMTDRTNTVTSWVEIKRSRIEVEPNSSIEVPITFRIHPYAEPGVYHLFIGLVEAKNRPAAEAVAMAGEADGVLVKITVDDKREDNMHISGFLTDRFVVTEDDKTISVELENTGDLASAPSGEIIFYDSRGQEVASSLINENKSVVAPGEKVVLKAKIPIDDTIGRYKANVALAYGANSKFTLQDTTFFYMMSPYLLALVFGGILVSVTIVTLLFRRAFAPQLEDDDFDEVSLYVKQGYNREEYEHDINLKNNS